MAGLCGREMICMNIIGNNDCEKSLTRKLGFPLTILSPLFTIYTVAFLSMLKNQCSFKILEPCHSLHLSLWHNTQHQSYIALSSRSPEGQQQQSEGSAPLTGCPMVQGQAELTTLGLGLCRVSWVTAPLVARSHTPDCHWERCRSCYTNC